MATSLRRNVRVHPRRRLASRRGGYGPTVGALFDELAAMVLAVCRYHLGIASG